MSSDAPTGESTDPEVAVDVVEGLTDRPTLARPRSEETQVAQLPERPTTPATEIVHSVAPARPESGPARASAPATEIVPPITSAGFGPDELPDLPRTQTTGETSFNPEVYRRRRLIFTLSIAALALITLTSIYQLNALGGSDEIAVTPSTRTPVQVPTTAPSEPPSAGGDTIEDLRGKKTARLLALTLDEILSNGRSGAVEVGDGPIKAGAVTIVNLWATYCEPCKEELPGFSELMARSAWGDTVRFTPILIDDKDPVWAHLQFASLMPEGSRFFVDPLQGAVVEALRAPKLLRPDSGLPVTLVYDCRQLARVVYTQRLSPADFLKLEEIVEDLRGELKSPYCKPRPRRPVQAQHRESQDPQDPQDLLLPIKQAAKQSLTRCGDGVCDPGESAGNCCDCRCADGKRCPEGKRCPDGKRCESPNGEAICVDSVRRLKD